MRLEFRPARAADLAQVSSVFASAIDDLNRKHGFFERPTSTSPPNPLYSFWLKKDPSSFWVAEEGDRVVGYTFSFLRGSLWFLADLFISPTFQGKGVGRSLIQKTLSSWKGHRIGNRALITPAFNRSSVSLYMRFGMYPRQPVYFAAASREDVAQGLKRTRSQELQVEEVAEPDSSKLSNIHRLAMGFPAGWHNEYFSRVQKARCILFRKNGRLEGYGFLGRDGRVGPLVVKSEQSFKDALEGTLDIAASGSSKEVTMFFAGTNRDAVQASIRHGFRITYPLLFLSARPMGDWGNYLFYSPGLM